MAIEQLDKKTALELREGEMVIYKNAPKVSHRKYFMYYVRYNFVITNQRIALVPYKKSRQQVDISYEDIAYVFPTMKLIMKNPNISGNDRGDKAYFALHMKDEGFFRDTFFPKYKFMVEPKMLETFKLLGKEVLSEMKDALADMAQVADYQSRANAIDSNNQIYDKSAAKSNAWWETANEWKKYSEKGTGKKVKSSNIAACNTIVELVSAAVEAAKGAPQPTAGNS